jgi:hypothetical protein
MASKKGVVFAPPNIALCVQSWNMMKSFTLQEENKPYILSAFAYVCPEPVLVK